MIDLINDLCCPCGGFYCDPGCDCGCQGYDPADPDEPADPNDPWVWIDPPRRSVETITPAGDVL